MQSIGVCPAVTGVAFCVLCDQVSTLPSCKSSISGPINTFAEFEFRYRIHVRKIYKSQPWQVG